MAVYAGVSGYGRGGARRMDRLMAAERLEERRWRAVLSRCADGAHFFYGVLTTGIYRKCPRGWPAALQALSSGRTRDTCLVRAGMPRADRRRRRCFGRCGQGGGEPGYVASRHGRRSGHRAECTSARSARRSPARGALVPCEGVGGLLRCGLWFGFRGLYSECAGPWGSARRAV